MSKYYRTLLSEFKSIEIIQAKNYNTVSIAASSSTTVSFDNLPQNGNKIIIMVGCDQVRTNNIVGGTIKLNSTGSSLPGRVWTINDYSNSYTIQNTSASTGTFRISMIEVKNCSTVVGVESLFVNNNTIISSSINISKNEMILVFLHKQNTATVSATNSFVQIIQTTQVSAWNKLYDSGQLNQTTTLSYTGTAQLMREYTLKLIP